jgi:hypothetical protein
MAEHVRHGRAASLLWLIPWMLWVKSTDIAAQPKANSRRHRRKPVVRPTAHQSRNVGDHSRHLLLHVLRLLLHDVDAAVLQERHGMSITQMGWYSGVSFAGMAAVAALAGFAADG